MVSIQVIRNSCKMSNFDCWLCPPLYCWCYTNALRVRLHTPLNVLCCSDHFNLRYICLTSTFFASWPQHRFQYIFIILSMHFLWFFWTHLHHFYHLLHWLYFKLLLWWRLLQCIILCCPVERCRYGDISQQVSAKICNSTSKNYHRPVCRSTGGAGIAGDDDYSDNDGDCGSWDAEFMKVNNIEAAKNVIHGIIYNTQKVEIKRPATDWKDEVKMVWTMFNHLLNFFTHSWIQLWLERLSPYNLFYILFPNWIGY